MKSSNEEDGDINVPPAVPKSHMKWMEGNEIAGVVLAFVLLVFYITPVFLFFIAAWKTDVFQEESVLLSWFSAFIKSSDSTLSSFHKVLLPIISGLSVVTFRKKSTKPMFTLGLFVLFSFVFTVFVAVILDMPTTQAALIGHKDFDFRLAKAFFTRIEETLMMYFMILIGLNVANKHEGK
jgi:hypothetical protein